MIPSDHNENVKRSSIITPRIKVELSMTVDKLISYERLKLKLDLSEDKNLLLQLTEKLINQQITLICRHRCLFLPSSFIQKSAPARRVKHLSLIMVADAPLKRAVIYKPAAPRFHTEVDKSRSLIFSQPPL